MPEDYVKRSDVHKAFQPKYAPAINRTFAAMIDSVPAADVVEVVRCRECEYRDYDDAPYGKKVAVCTGAMAYSNTPDDWYCPMGKRKDGGQDDV